jgi:hypothetical protein
VDSPLRGIPRNRICGSRGLRCPRPPDYFSILWRRLLKHGVFTSETDLAEQMLAYIETYNQTAKPFKWTYTGNMAERVSRGQAEVSP